MAAAGDLRLATWHADLSRKGPGLLLRDLLRDDKTLIAAVDQIAGLQPDVLLLTDIDYDYGLVALGTLQKALAARGLNLPFVFSARPNNGMPTGIDIDGDGRLGGPRDAQGYGWFSGQGGQALISRFPMSLTADLGHLLWSEVPDSSIVDTDTGHAVQRLSSSAHWSLQAAVPGGPLTLLTVAATPPLFDGPEDRNGRRNRDEVLLWLHAIEGRLDYRPKMPFVLMGNLQLDPERGDGYRDVVRDVLDHPALQDPLPGQSTASFQNAGDLRLSYILPSADLIVRRAGVAQSVEGVGPHRLVWVDLTLP